MKEIAATFETAGLPAGFHNAAAELWARLAPFKDQADPLPAITDVIDSLRVNGKHT